ncbi:MAG: hypothetical protein ACTSWC_04640 [Promethearchaeota archaeon]
MPEIEIDFNIFFPSKQIFNSYLEILKSQKVNNEIGIIPEKRKFF